MCSAILHGGAPLLTRMAAGWSTCDGWSARCQAAALLHFCLSRVRLEVTTLTLTLTLTLT